MSFVMVVVRRNPCDTNHEAYQVGFMEEEFDTEVLKDIRFGLSTGGFFKLIGLTPNRAMKLFPNCGVPKNKLSWRLKRSLSGWDPLRWTWLGLLLTKEEFQRLANLVGLPVLRYNYDRKGDRIVQFVARTDPEVSGNPA